MKYIRLKNLRGFADTGPIPVLPLTVLLGRNSAGKSTFLRSLPLLRQSVEARSTSPIVWYGDVIDFGSFSEAVRRDADDKTIELEFNIDIPLVASSSRRSVAPRPIVSSDVLLSASNITANMTLVEAKKDGGTILSSLSIALCGHNISIHVNDDGKVILFKVNNTNILQTGADFHAWPTYNLLPYFTEVAKAAEESPTTRLLPTPPSKQIVLAHLAACTWQFVHGKRTPEVVQNIIDSYRIGTSQSMLQNMRAIDGGKFWADHVSTLSIRETNFIRLRDLTIAHNLPQLLEIVDSAIGNFARSVSYIGPFRATAERYYRPRGLSIDAVDHEGRNLAEFLRNRTEAERKSFLSWIQEHFGFSITARSSGGHLSLEVTEERQSGEAFNLADVGFGLSQILPVSYRYEITFTVFGLIV